MNLADHQKEVLLLLQDPVLQGTASSWALVPQLAVLAGWLMFERESSEGLAKCQCPRGRAVDAGRGGMCWVLCASRAERISCKVSLCCKKKKVFNLQKTSAFNWVSWQSHLPGAVTAVLQDRTAVMSCGLLPGKLCSCTWSYMQDVIKE